MLLNSDCSAVKGEFITPANVFAAETPGPSLFLAWVRYPLTLEKIGIAGGLERGDPLNCAGECVAKVPLGVVTKSGVP